MNVPGGQTAPPDWKTQLKKASKPQLAKPKEEGLAGESRLNEIYARIN